MSLTPDRVLAALRTASGYVSSHALCQTLGVSRTAIWKHVNALRTRGYLIESCPHRGYRLGAVPNAPLVSEVEPFLRTARLGRPLVFLPETDSTNRVAAELAGRAATEGTAVVADAQTAGRGRLARRWFSPAGRNLYVSVVLRPSIAPPHVPQVALLAALAVVHAVRSLRPALVLGIKWPNDVFLNGRKLAGILCEMESETDRVRHLVLGVGINVNVAADEFPPEIADLATSLRRETGEEVSRPRLLAALLNELEPLYDGWCARGLPAFRAEWEALSILQGGPVRVEQLASTIEGTACGLSDLGGLRVRLADGTMREVLSGDAHLGSARQGGARP